MSDLFFVWFCCLLPTLFMIGVFFFDYWEDELYDVKWKQGEAAHARLLIKTYLVVGAMVIFTPLALIGAFLVGIGFLIQHVVNTFQKGYGSEDKTPKMKRRLFKR